jgi:hypothetical protein
MFLGHFGVALGAKSAAPQTSLGALVLAAQLIDLLWPTFLALGWERVRIEPGATRVTPLAFDYYPWSHSLLIVIVWALVVAVVYQGARRYPRGALVLAGCVVSHWLLDALMHRPDLPLYPGSMLVGLGAWCSIALTLALEGLVFAAGLALYLKSTRPVDRTGQWALWSFVGALLLIYLASVLGPPPPGVSAVTWAGQAQWLLVVWAYWIDRHRRAVA